MICLCPYQIWRSLLHSSLRIRGLRSWQTVEKMCRIINNSATHCPIVLKVCTKMHYGSAKPCSLVIQTKNNRLERDGWPPVSIRRWLPLFSLVSFLLFYSSSISYICPSRLSPLLGSGASRIADLQCGTVCHQPCSKTWLSLLTFKTKLKTYFSGVHNGSRRPPGAVAAFSRSRRRDISDFACLLTYFINL